MENPFLRLSKTNRYLRVGIFLSILLGILIVVFTPKKVEESIKEVYIYKKIFVKDSEDSSKIDELQKELKQKDSELKKLTLVKEKIKNHILAKNSDISEKVADKYAMTIVKESNKRGHSPIIQTALLDSESSFRSNPKHALGGVVGMGGIYWNVWKDQLRKEGIAYSKEDLRNPIVNIKASAYVVSCYMKECHQNNRLALTHYKGYSSLGRSQAENVLQIAMKIRTNTKA